MRYFYMEPEVSGRLGDGTIMDRSVHPPIISELHYEMEGWLGEAILESFPAFIVTEQARQGLISAAITGASFAEVHVTTSETFRELYPAREIPPFAWLKPVGKAAHDDFGTASDGRLVVSERALQVLRKFGTENALVEPFVDHAI
ncbi:hypothetical protein HJB99_08270 [Rhizobium sp. NLR17b]|uniref:hypothetical protein n=1 Tax=Rhizobium sp. NLR17b TaxID=2731114 RepID=UPI001C83FC63|nr:hypothetical protein [Rhizobium sp. NLR17b]MBX5268668.1 hypothetical protein [Rhizobium sp. NLR17b]